MLNGQLQVLTSYSLLASTNKIPELVKKAKENNYQSIAMTDLNVMSGAADFYRQVSDAGMKPLIGLTIKYRHSLQEIEETSLILLAKNQSGYENIMEISTMKMEKYANDHLYFEKILPYLSNVIVIFDDIESQVYRYYQQQRKHELAELIEKLQEAADPGSLFAGVSLLGNASGHKESWVDLLKTNEIPVVALHEVRYLNPTDDFAVKVLKHLDDGTQLAFDSIQQTGHSYLPNREQMTAAYQNAGLEEAIDNVNNIIEMCQFEMLFNQTLLPHYDLDPGLNAGEFLEAICLNNLQKRVPRFDERYTERLSYELSVIKKMGFVDYFLIIWDVMNFAAEKKIVIGPGRGSAAGSLVSFLTNITDVDPIKYDLLFERFLNIERYTMPDIDLDIPDNRRDEVLAYVNEKYGHHHVAQIATFGTLAAKMALRDVCRVFGLSQNEANAWSNSIPNTLKITLQEAFDTSKTLRDLVAVSDKNKMIFEVASKIEGLPRHVSTHAAGVVISDKNLAGLVPLQAGSGDIPLTQFTMGDVEGIGLLKMDFLGLRNLSILDDTLSKIRHTYHQEVVLQDIPMNDEATLKLFRQGKTVGVFQFESAGIKNVLRKLGPTSIEDVAAVNALYRPGPMENIDLFIDRKKGRVPISYPHANLEDILSVTYGIVVYQEQIMQIASKMAGFSLGEADILRRAISKKKKEVLDEEREHFVKGSLSQGYTSEVANEVYDYIERFANYGFNRSHAMAYAFIAYWLAYLKSHYPAPFFVSLLHSVRHNQDKVKEYINDGKRMGLKISGLDINYSQYSFQLSKEKIVFGFSSVKGLRSDFIKNILATRKADGPFKSLDNFLLRIDHRWLKMDTIEPLIFSGAFDKLHGNRRQLIEDLPGMIKNIAISGGSLDLLSMLSLKKESIEDYPVSEKLMQEVTYLGTYLSGHPVDAYQSLKVVKGVKSIDLLDDNSQGNILIYLRKINVIRTKKGEQMAFIDGHDSSGEIAVTIFPNLYRQVKDLLIKDNILLISGKVERSRYNQERQLIADRLELASHYHDKIGDKICYLKIDNNHHDQSLLPNIQEICASERGIIPVMLFDEKSQKKFFLSEKYWVKDSPELRQKLTTILGLENVIIQ